MDREWRFDTGVNLRSRTTLVPNLNRLRILSIHQTGGDYWDSFDAYHCGFFLIHTCVEPNEK